MLSKTGTTIGKRLWNIKLFVADGSCMSLRVAIKRTMDVWWRGGNAITLVPALGLLIYPVVLIVQFNYLNKFGITSWDRELQIVYAHEPLQESRIPYLVTGFIFALFIILPANAIYLSMIFS
jgi:hypothetical protein